MDEMDRFAEIPLDLIQIILSSLPTTKEAVQKGILSKNFQQACYTIPHLNFSSDDFSALNDVVSRTNMAVHVYITLLRYQVQTISLSSLCLRFIVVNDENEYIFKQCILEAKKLRVKEVQIDISFSTPFNALSTLLQDIFALKDQLVVLKLDQCDLVKGVRVDEIKNCFSLRILKLDRVRLDERVLRKLFCSCSLVEELVITRCRQPELIQVADLPNLKRLQVSRFRNQKVDVKVPSLATMEIEQLDSFQIIPSFSPCLITIDSTRNLKELYLRSTNITSHQLDNLLVMLPALERLILQHCLAIEKINMSSHSLSFLSLVCCRSLKKVDIDAPNIKMVNVSSQSLRFLSLVCCRSLKEVNIDAPNLFQFELEAYKLPSLCFASGGSGKRKSSLILHLDNLEKTSSFVKLSKFLMNFNSSDIIALYIESKCIRFDRNIIVDLRERSPEFKEVFVRVSSPSSMTATLMKGLLWSFSSKTLYMMYYTERDEIIQNICKELLVEHVEDESSRNHFKHPMFVRYYEWRLSLLQSSKSLEGPI